MRIGTDLPDSAIDARYNRPPSWAWFPRDRSNVAGVFDPKASEATGSDVLSRWRSGLPDPLGHPHSGPLAPISIPTTRDFWNLR